MILKIYDNQNLPNWRDVFSSEEVITLDEWDVDASDKTVAKLSTFLIKNCNINTTPNEVKEALKSGEIHEKLNDWGVDWATLTKANLTFITNGDVDIDYVLDIYFGSNIMVLDLDGEIIDDWVHFKDGEISEDVLRKALGSKYSDQIKIDLSYADSGLTNLTELEEV